MNSSNLLSFFNEMNVGRFFTFNLQDVNDFTMETTTRIKNNFQSAFRWIFILLLSSYGTRLEAQRAYHEGVVQYQIESITKDKTNESGIIIPDTWYRIILKGTLTRTELVSPAGITATLHDAKAEKGTMISEYGNQKILVALNREDMADRNKKYEQAEVIFKEEKKTILGYECKHALLKLKDGTIIHVYVAPGLQFQNKHYDSPFHFFSGFPLEFESEVMGEWYRYTATKVLFDVVPSAQFDLPKKGYTEMNYQEVKKMQSLQ
jgi:hypothetical protein